MESTDTPRTMITFTRGKRKFTYRVGGIAISQGRVLCQKASRDPNNIFWFLPGGRAELDESSEETLRREVQEELGEEAQVGRLLYFAEIFFTDTVDKLEHHEIGLYFELIFPATSYLYQEPGPFLRPEEESLPMIFEWLPISELTTKFRLRPDFLSQALQELPAHIQHIIHFE